MNSYPVATPPPPRRKKNNGVEKKINNKRTKYNTYYTVRVREANEIFTEIDKLPRVMPPTNVDQLIEIQQVFSLVRSGRVRRGTSTHNFTGDVQQY